MKYSAIDLHSNNSVVVVSDEEDRVLVQKRVANDLRLIIELLVPHRDELAVVVVESTYNWYWLADGLMAAGYPVKLANTRNKWGQTPFIAFTGRNETNDADPFY